MYHFNWRRKWQPTPVFLPGESHGQRNLAGCSPCGHKSRTRLSDFDLTTDIRKRELTLLASCFQQCKYASTGVKKDGNGDSVHPLKGSLLTRHFCDC